MTDPTRPMPAVATRTLPDTAGIDAGTGAHDARAAGGGKEPWRGHIPALDGVRGLAIVLVMISHVTLGLRADVRFDRELIEVVRSGWMGVDLFFVLSGFLITGILLDARGRPHYFRNFYIRRTLRIFPLYYGILAAVFIAMPLLVPGVREQAWFAGAHENRAWFWTYTSNVLLAREGTWEATPILGGFWSLAVEEQFYLL